MLVYCDPATGDALWTAALAEGVAPPPRTRIEVAGTDVHPALWRVEGGALVAREDGIAALRAEAVARVNAMAGEVRARHVTVIPAQDMVCLLKEAEAVAFLADPEPVLADHPFVAAEVGITAPTAAEVAQVHVNLAAQLKALAAALEAARLGAVAAIEAAETPAEVEAAVAACAAALEAFA